MPFKAFALNEVWLEIVLLAHDLIVWTQALLLDGELAKTEPKRLRYRLLHVVLASPNMSDEMQAPLGSGASTPGARPPTFWPEST